MKIINGDTLEELKKMPDESIDVVITSPPYYMLRSYLPLGHTKKEREIGLEDSPEEYLEKLLAVTNEIKRVLKRSGSVWWNHGDSYDKNGNMYMMPEAFAMRMQQQGWVLRQKIIWAKQILVDNRTIGPIMPTSVKTRFNPSYEYIFHFIREDACSDYYILVSKEIPEVCEKYKYGVWKKEEIPPEYLHFFRNLKYYFDLDAVRLPHQVQGVTDLRPPGVLRQRTYEGSKYNKYNYIPSKTGLLVSTFRQEDTEDKYNKRGFSKRYKSQRKNPNYKGMRQAPEPGEEGAFCEKGKNIPTVWQINPQPHAFEKEFGVEIEHFAAFPDELPEIPIKVSCPPKGVVLDPFCGSGTVGVVCQRLKRKFIGIDINPKYCELTRLRIEKEKSKIEKEENQLSLFEI